MTKHITTLLLRSRVKNALNKDCLKLNWRKWNQNQTKMSNNFHEFPYALILLDKDISEYSRASALCSEQLAQFFRVYTGYMGSRITWSIYNFSPEVSEWSGSPSWKSQNKSHNFIIISTITNNAKQAELAAEQSAKGKRLPTPNDPSNQILKTINSAYPTVLFTNLWRNAAFYALFNHKSF